MLKLNINLSWKSSSNQSLFKVVWFITRGETKRERKLVFLGWSHPFLLIIFRMWWTLTGNYGNILPIDWSKSMTRRLHLPTLQLCDRQVKENEFPCLNTFVYSVYSNKLSVFLEAQSRGRHVVRRGWSCGIRFGLARPHRGTKSTWFGHWTAPVSRRSHQGNWRSYAGKYLSFYYPFYLKNFHFHFDIHPVSCSGSVVAGNERKYASKSRHARMFHALPTVQCNSSRESVVHFCSQMLVSNFITFVCCRVGNVVRWPIERAPLWAGMARSTSLRNFNRRAGASWRVGIWKGVKKHFHLVAVECAE